MARLDSVPATLAAREPSSASAVPAAQVTSRHSALVRVTHWITTLCFFALLVSGMEIVISHPRFYWGETGNVLTPAAVQDADPLLAGNSAHRLRVRAAGPERLEPLSPLSSRLGGGIDRLAVCDLRLLTGHFRKNLLPAGADLSWRALSSAFANHLRFKRPGEAEAWSYNVLQRLSLPVRDLRSVPAGDLDGPGDVSRLRFRVSGRRHGVRRPAIRAHDSFLRLHASRALPAGPRRDGLSCRIQEPHARHDHGPRRGTQKERA